MACKLFSCKSLKNQDMILRHLFTACAAACIAVTPLNAQTAGDYKNNDIGFTVGTCVPMYEGVENDVIVGITYGHFDDRGIGFRTGFQYSPSVAEVDHAFGIPVAFAFRTKSRDSGTRTMSAIDGAHSYIEDNYWNAQATGVVGAFLLSLFSNAEFSVGITPGYIAGGNSGISTGTWILPQGRYWESSWTERNHRLSMTLDAGACLDYRIWRFDVKFMPAFHYNLTNNYLLHESKGNDAAGETGRSTTALRWFFSFSGGLTFSF